MNEDKKGFEKNNLALSQYEENEDEQTSLSSKKKHTINNSFLTPTKTRRDLTNPSFINSSQPYNSCNSNERSKVQNNQCYSENKSCYQIIDNSRLGTEDKKDGDYSYIEKVDISKSNPFIIIQMARVEKRTALDLKILNQKG